MFASTISRPRPAPTSWRISQERSATSAVRPAWRKMPEATAIDCYPMPERTASKKCRTFTFTWWEDEHSAECSKQADRLNKCSIFAQAEFESNFSQSTGTAGSRIPAHDDVHRCNAFVHVKSAVARFALRIDSAETKCLSAAIGGEWMNIRIDNQMILRVRFGLLASGNPDRCDIVAWFAVSFGA